VKSTVINSGNHRVGVTATLKNMQSYGFLNMKLKDAKHKTKGKKIIRTLPVAMKEDRTWSEELMIRKGFFSKSTLKIFLSLKSESGKVPNKSLNYLYPLHKPFTNHKAPFPYRPSPTTLHISDKLTVHI